MSSPNVTEARQPNTSRLRFTLPALDRYSLLATLLIVFAALLPFLDPTDVDFWWHLRVGQLIWETGIPYQDTMSFTASGQPWIEHEWLGQLIIYWLYQLGGYPLLAITFGLLQAAGCLLVYRLLRFIGAGSILTLLLLLLYFALAYPTWAVRPQVFAPLLLAVFYLILLRYRRHPAATRALWLLPPLSVLWANLHGSYIIGLVILAVFIVGEAANNWLYRPSAPTPLRPLLFVGLATTLATLLNPYFINIWLLLRDYISLGGQNQLAYVAEWQPPNFRSSGGLLLAASFGLLLLFGLAHPTTKLARQRWRVPLRRYVDITSLIIILGFSWQALGAVKAVPLYTVAVLPIIASSLIRALPLLSARHDRTPSPERRGINLLLASSGAVLLAVLILTAPQAQTSWQPRTADNDVALPVAAADYVDKLPTSVRMYNEFNWGGYLLYRLYPTHLTFIDGRFDMFRGRIMEDYVAVQNVSYNWRKVLDRYAINLVLIQPYTQLDEALGHEPGWQVTYRDEQAIIYQR